MSDIIDKLQKLIAMEQSAREIGSLAEASAFAGKVQELLTKHKLTMDDVEIKARKEEEPIQWEPVTPAERRWKKMDLWRQIIADSVAKSNTCAYIAISPDMLKKARVSVPMFFFVGRRSDRDLCKTLFFHFVDAATRAAVSSWQIEIDEKDKLLVKRYGRVHVEYLRKEINALQLKHRRHFMNGFYQGFAMTIAKRLQEAKAKAEAECNNTTAIVHIDEDEKLVKEEIAGKTKTQVSKSRTQKSEAGLLAGMDSGNAICLNPHMLGGDRGSTTLSK